MTRDLNGDECKRRYTKHDMTRLLKARRQAERALHPRSKLGRKLHAWKQSVIDDLGGLESVSAMELELVSMAARSKLILDSIDGWILQQPRLVNKRARSIFPMVRERQQIANGLGQHLAMLGLKRRRPPAPRLTDYLEKKTNGKEATPGPAAGAMIPAAPKTFSATQSPVPRPASDSPPSAPAAGALLMPGGPGPAGGGAGEVAPREGGP